MPKISLILFCLIVISLTICVLLYRDSRKNSLKFYEGARTVKEVMLLLERVEKLENNLRQSVSHTHGSVAHEFEFTENQQRELDSALNVLHRIVLYDYQRGRIDTIRQILSINIPLLSDTAQGARYTPVMPVIARAQAYAETRLAEQEAAFQRHEKSVDLWINLIMGISLGLLIVGIWSTRNEYLAKRRLKTLHEAILTSASIGISVFEVRRQRKNHEHIRLVYENYGAICRASNELSEEVINLTDRFEAREMQESARMIVQSGKNLIRELYHVHNNKEFWFITGLSKVSDHHVAFYYQDITRLKEVERDLLQKVAELESVNRDLEQFAHATSHDLKEPFRKIQFLSDLVIHEHSPANDKRYLEKIYVTARKGTELVEQILNYSKIQFDRSALDKVDLNAVLSQAIDNVDLLIMEKHAKINADALPTVIGNKTQLVQLFTNLLNNGIKFSFKERTPEISITWSLTYAGAIAGLTDSPTYAAINFEDNGIGIDQAYHGRIFQAFERLNNYHEFAGSGLGLSLCKKIVLNHKGTIKLRSVLGTGSTFTVYLPLEEPSNT